MDGSLNATNTTILTADFFSPSANLSIGNMNGGYLLNGSLDEVAIHNVELAPTEITQHYNNGVLGLGYYETATAPVITSIAPVDAVEGQLYSYDVNATGNPVPTYSLADPFPAGMTIDPVTGLIEWTPATATSGNLNITVVASNGVTPTSASSQTFIINVTSAPVIQAFAKSAETVSTGFDSPQIEIHELKVYPNPFSNRLRFEFVAPADVNARIDLYDMTGRMVKTIFEQAVEDGVNYEAEFRPEATVSGMYIYRAIMGDAVYNGKVVFKKE